MLVQEVFVWRRQMNCCCNCFSHEWLAEYIDRNSKERGDCAYCGSKAAPIIDTAELTGYFRNLLAMYVVADSFESGESLSLLIQWRWSVFSDSLTVDGATNLLEDIANAGWDDDDGEPQLDAHELYTPVFNTPYHATRRETWEQFCSDVREKPETDIPFGEFMGEELAESEERIPANAVLYRARIGFTLEYYDGRKPWTGEDIGAPPASSSMQGRANAEGQRVLYVADEEKTAVSEVRPALGYYVSVGTLALRRECRVLDLTKDLPPINPFTSESLEWHVEIRGLLDSLGEEMSRPLERTDDRTHYVPCQRFSEKFWLRRDPLPKCA
jgi:RES domain